MNRHRKSREQRQQMIEAERKRTPAAGDFERVREQLERSRERKKREVSKPKARRTHNGGRTWDVVGWPSGE